MKTISKKLSTSLLLSILILMQSCRVYHKQNVSLDEAINSQKRVKIETSENKKLKFKQLVKDENKIYGIEVKKGVQNMIPLNTEDINSVRLHNKPASIVLGIGLGAVITGVVVLSIVAAGLSAGGYNLGPIFIY